MKRSACLIIIEGAFKSVPTRAIELLLGFFSMTPYVGKISYGSKKSKKRKPTVFYAEITAINAYVQIIINNSLR